MRSLLLSALILASGSSASARAAMPGPRTALAPTDSRSPAGELPEVSTQPGAEDAGPERPAPGASPDEDVLVLSSALGTVELGGRLDVRESLEQQDGGGWEGKLAIPAARLELTYRWKKRLRAVVELDAAQGELKDAFAWLKVTRGVAVRAGRFKVPFSLVELESTTRLPLVRRGLLRDVLDGALGLTGRKPGAQLEWTCQGCSQELSLRAGAWQTQDPDKKVALSEGLGLIPTVRGTWGLGNLQLGVSALYQPAGASESSGRKSWATALDVRHTLPLGNAALRTWAEALTGRAGLLGEVDGNFLLGRAVTALRLGGSKRGAWYAEPFVMLSALDPDAGVDSDLLWEGTAGLNVGHWERWRLQAQFESRKAGANTPAVLETLEKDLVTRRALFVQLEVGF